MTESLDTLTKSHTTQNAPPAPDSLPRGSALLLETILMLARQIKAGDDVLQMRDKAASIEDMAAELVAKYKRQMGLAA